ncbi:MAG TPA: hypothetical protein VI912_03665 [Candidatus Bilamarchaeaceae archaeon]|nr:hypothetical protein [Candidatus Bilamarchaeaceae archaeon]
MEESTPKDTKSKITELEDKKGKLIDRIRQLNKRIKHKKYEHKALEPFVEKTKDVRIGPLRRQKRAIEFRISTQAYTPKMEREWLKEVKKIDDELAKVKEIEWARRKKKLVEQDIEEGEKEIETIEKELKELRTKLKDLYEDVRTKKVSHKKTVGLANFEDDLVSMGDLVEIEDERKEIN